MSGASRTGVKTSICTESTLTFLRIQSVAIRRCRLDNAWQMHRTDCCLPCLGLEVRRDVGSTYVSTIDDKQDLELVHCPLTTTAGSSTSKVNLHGREHMVAGL